MFGKRESRSQNNEDRRDSSNNVAGLRSYLELRVAGERRKQLKIVKLIYNNKYSVSDGILRDISESGAKIEIAENMHLPDTFLIETPCGSISKTCHRIWKNGSFIGVKFSQTN